VQAQLDTAAAPDDLGTALSPDMPCGSALEVMQWAGLRCSSSMPYYGMKVVP